MELMFEGYGVIIVFAFAFIADGINLFLNGSFKKYFKYALSFDHDFDRIRKNKEIYNKNGIVIHYLIAGITILYLLLLLIYKFKFFQ